MVPVVFFSERTSKKDTTTKEDPSPDCFLFYNILSRETVKSPTMPDKQIRRGIKRRK